MIDVTEDVAGINHALFNHKGEQLSDFGYMVFAELVEGMIKPRIADRYGFLFPDGKVAIPIKFEYCELGSANKPAFIINDIFCHLRFLRNPFTSTP